MEIHIYAHEHGLVLRTHNNVFVIRQAITR